MLHLGLAGGADSGLMCFSVLERGGGGGASRFACLGSVVLKGDEALVAKGNLKPLTQSHGVGWILTAGPLLGGGGLLRSVLATSLPDGAEPRQHAAPALHHRRHLQQPGQRAEAPGE